MAGQQTQLVVTFAQAVTELVTVEKKNIVVLTEIARDALRTEPQSAPSLAAMITNRIVQAPVAQKLPVLYLLDSISKLVGEPYKTLFAPALPEAYMSAWQQGGTGLQRPLDKLLGTWTGVFPQQVLADIRNRVATARAAQAPAQPAAANGFGSGGFGYGAVVQAPAVQPQPMAADPRLVLPTQQPQMQQPGFAMQPSYGMQAASQVQPGYPLQQQQQHVQYEQQQPQPMYGMQQLPAYQQQQPAPAYGGYPAPGPGPGPTQQPTYYQAPQQATAAAVQQQQQVSVPDLLSSLMTAGLLAAPSMPPAAPLALSGSGLHSTPPYVSAAASATPEREQPATTTFTPERIKEHNPSAVSRLLRQTEATKSRFLDRKFLRRQQKAAGSAAHSSRLWYVDLDTWMASTVGSAPAAAGAAAAAGAGGAGRGSKHTAASAVAAVAAENHSVPVDDSQTHCALSGEQFEQFWDEGHQEWRYKDAKRLDAEEAASYGLEEGSIVLVSALGKPAAGLELGGVAPGGSSGVLSELQAQHEIAADLAAAAAVVGQEGSGVGHDAKDVKLGLKHPRDEGEEGAAGAAGTGLGGLAAQEKRPRVE